VAELGRLDVLVHNAAVFVQGLLAAPDRTSPAMANQFRANLFRRGRRDPGRRRDLRQRPDRAGQLAQRGRSFGQPTGDYSAPGRLGGVRAGLGPIEFGPAGSREQRCNWAHDTEMLDGRPPADALLTRLPLRRLGRPRDRRRDRLPGRPGASYITGATLRADAASAPEVVRAFTSRAWAGSP